MDTLFGPREPASIEGMKCAWCGKSASFVRRNTLVPGGTSRRDAYWCKDHDDYRKNTIMSELTISQGLRQIKKLKGRLSEASQRAAKAVSYKKNDPPAFAFRNQIEQITALRAELGGLTTQVRVTCATTQIEFEGRKMTLTEAIAKLEDLRGEIAWFRSLPVRPHDETSETEMTYNDAMQRVMMTISWHCDLPEAKQAEKIQSLQDHFDRLNDTVEKANHATVLKAIA